MKKIIAFLLMISFLYLPIFSQQNNSNLVYTDEDFPSWAKNLRRAEIVTLGALPFTTLLASLGYSLYGTLFQDKSFVNPLAKGSFSPYSEEEIKGLLITSISLSLCVGITDIVVNTIKTHKKRSDIEDSFSLGEDIQINTEPRELPKIKIEE